MYVMLIFSNAFLETINLFLLKCGKDFKHLVQAASNKYSQNILSIKQIIILSINDQKTGCPR